MTLRFYNTLTRRKEEFKPIKEGTVGIYVCGITVYDICHVGHARSAIVFDVITKYFKYRGYDVTYVKNYTDVDDKIIAKANAEGVGIREISERYIKEHDRDMAAAGVAMPTIGPKATDHIGGMISLIQGLLDRGLAYVVEGDVYYAVDRFPGYGRLSGRNLDEMMAGARVDIDERKKNPLDFALWKASKEGEPWWDSPWGKGRPGWHIECSVMSQRYLGETFDIHGGGEDLIFPHHENEIAQSEGVSGKPLANYWIHNGFIKVDSEKMSKSLGNVFAIRDILMQYHPEVLRLFVLQSHYKSPLDFSADSLAEARAGMGRFYETLKRMDEVLSLGTGVSTLTAEALSGKDKEVFESIHGLRGRFVAAMDDDFNTARALGYLFDSVRVINGYLGDPHFTATPRSLFVVSATRDAVREVGGVLGLLLDAPADYFQKDRRREAAKRGLNTGEIEDLIEERKKARQAKDWKRADEIRNALSGKGITLKDESGITTWSME